MSDIGQSPDIGSVYRSNHNKEVSDYYSHTWLDYFSVWMSQENLALHFGYQDGNQLSHSESLSNSNRVLADTVGIMPGERVLDAGCGVGGSSLWLAANREVTTTGVALGLDQVVLARREAERRRLTGKCKFLVADFQCLPFPDRCFDVVWAQESLCHSSAKSVFFKEAYRVLRRDGRIIVADFFLRSQNIGPSNRVVLKEWLDGWKIPSLWTAAQHSNAARSAGFSCISVKDVTRCTACSHRRLYNLAVLALPIAVTLEQAGMRNAMQHGNVIASLQQYRALKSNCWFYVIFSARK